MTGLLINDPIKFADVLQSSRVLPGDVLTLLPGAYIGDWIIPAVISGTSEEPVKIKPYAPGTVTIDGSLVVEADHIEIYDIDFTDSRADRHLLTPSIDISMTGISMYGCIISDMHRSGVNWFGSGAGNICENIILNNGNRDAENNEHGQGIYTHNNLGGARAISRNVFFDQFGEYTIQIYSGGNNWLQDYTVQDNIICGDSVHIGGGLGVKNMLYKDNVQMDGVLQLGLYSQANYDALIDGNLMIDMAINVTNDWQALTEQNNTLWGGSIVRDGYTSEAKPATWSKITPFTKSARWLASVAIYNRDSAASVAVDFSGFANGNYKLRNAQNPAETWQFENTGAAVNVPTNWTSAARIGEGAQGTTWPVFGGLVLEAA